MISMRDDDRKRGDGRERRTTDTQKQKRILGIGCSMSNKVDGNDIITWCFDRRRPSEAACLIDKKKN